MERGNIPNRCCDRRGRLRHPLAYGAMGSKVRTRRLLKTRKCGLPMKQIADTRNEAFVPVMLLRRRSII
jgi:hypothetical protein